jgi:CRISPR/Cas system-associated exonuclease Cas4 (RecB family)
VSTLPKITAWSFSRWNEYMSCPLKSKFKVIDKLKEPGSAAMDRGTELHKYCENYLRGMTKTIHKDVKPIAAELKDLKKRGALAEAEFTFRKDWSATGWFDKDAWCRVKADVTIPPIVDADKPVVEVHDFKSGGKMEADGSVVGKPEYPLQLELYALAGLLTYPLAVSAKTSLIFIDHGKVVVTTDEYLQKDVGLLKKTWEQRTKKMLSDTKFKPTPGNACRWCHFSKSRGGMCDY